jgi:hypothetical protein
MQNYTLYTVPNEEISSNAIIQISFLILGLVDNTMFTQIKAESQIFQLIFSLTDFPDNP